MQATCKFCGTVFEKATGAANRAIKLGLPLYCNKVCAGLGRRKGKTKEQKIAEKAAYDVLYRAKNLEKIKQAKHDWYAANHDREKEREHRKKNMARHVEYCRRPEYVAQKSQYDRQYRAKREFGEFWEAALLALQIEGEVDSRMSRYEIYSQNGTLNKAQKRKREL